jgi:hypothetical protein
MPVSLETKLRLADLATADERLHPGTREKARKAAHILWALEARAARVAPSVG